MPDLNVAPVKRWWCDEHRDQAAPGDLDALPSGVRADMTAVADPDEVAAEARQDERLQQVQAERNEQRRLRAIEQAEVERRREAQSERELFGGRPG